MAGKSKLEKDKAADAILRDGIASGATIDEATRAINADRSSDSKISRGSVGRRAKHHRADLADLQRRKENTDALVAALAKKGVVVEQRGIIALIQTLCLELLQDEKTITPDGVNKLARTLLDSVKIEDIINARETRAAELERRRLEEKTRRELAKTTPADKVEEMIARVYGVAQPPAKKAAKKPAKKVAKKVAKNG